MSISPLASGSDPIEQKKTKSEDGETKANNEPASIYHKLDTEGGQDGQKGDGKITAKEFGIHKILKSAQKYLKAAAEKATGDTVNLLKVLDKMIEKLGMTFIYDKNTEEGLKSVDREAASRMADAVNINTIALQMKQNNLRQAKSTYEKTEFGLLENIENATEIDAKDVDHNANARTLKAMNTTEQENEEYQKKREPELKRIMDAIVNIRKSMSYEELKEDRSQIPIPEGLKSKENFTIKQYSEDIVWKSADTKGEHREKDGSIMEVADALVITIKYTYKEVQTDGSIVEKEGSYSKTIEANEMPEDAKKTRKKEGSEIETQQKQRSGYSD